MDAFTKSFLLLLVLLNPFTLSVYLNDLIATVDRRRFAAQLVRGGLISLVVFLMFAWAGDSIFEDVLQVRFASFLIFGGITFLIIGIRLILGSGPPMDILRSGTDEVSASIAMPFLVGPGTISASVLAGSRMRFSAAALAIVLALATALTALVLIKVVHDIAHARHERLVQSYVAVANRVTALFIGSFAIEMIFTGIERWYVVLRGVS
jgi:small neutral amino acid transporter SnatA (MarC family)